MFVFWVGTMCGVTKIWWNVVPPAPALKMEAVFSSDTFISAHNSTEDQYRHVHVMTVVHKGSEFIFKCRWKMRRNIGRFYKYIDNNIKPIRRPFRIHNDNNLSVMSFKCLRWILSRPRTLEWSVLLRRAEEPHGTLATNRYVYCCK
jgi:hypothetical protein